MSGTRPSRGKVWSVVVVLVALVLAPVGGAVGSGTSASVASSVGGTSPIATGATDGGTSGASPNATSGDRTDGERTPPVDEIGRPIGVESLHDTSRGSAVSQPQRRAAVASSDPAFVYVAKDSGNLTLLRTDGTTVDYGVSAQVVGPRTELDDDGQREAPYVTSNNALKIVDNDGDVQQLAPSAEKSKTKLGIGNWDGDEHRDVFFSSGNGDLMRVDWDERGNPTKIDIGGKQVGSILGVTDVTGDGIREVVYIIDSSSLYYVNASGYVLMESSTLWGSNKNRGVGEPADFDGQGDYQFPLVGGDSAVELLREDTTTRQLVGTSSVKARKTAPTSADWVGDGTPEHVFVWYKYDGSTSGVKDQVGYVTTGGDFGWIQNASGDNVTVDPGPGLASGVSSFEVRESETTTGKAANFQLSAFTAVPNGSGGLEIGFESTEPITAATVDVSGATTLTVDETDLATDEASSPYVYNATVAVADGDYTVTFTSATSDGGVERSPGTTVEPRVDAVAPTVSGVTLTEDGDPDGSVGDGVVGPGDTVRVTADAGGGNGPTVTADLSAFDAGTVTLTESGGQYTGTATVGSSATDGAGDVTVTVTDDDGTTAQSSVTNLTVDATAPTVRAFEFVQSGQDLDVRVNSSEPLDSLSISLGEGATGTLSLADASNETSDPAGPYVYRADVASADGLYAATLDTATDATGNDGAGGETREVRVNTQAPSVSNVRVTTDDQNVDLVFESTEQLGNLTVDVDGAVDTNRTIDDSTNRSITGGYEYTVDVSDGRDGTFDVELASFEDEFGKNGTAGQTATTTVDTTAPTVQSFELVQSGQDLDVRVNASEPLDSLSVALSEDASGTLTLSDATNTTSGDTSPFVYVVDVASADGLYGVTLQTAADAAGNDGASRQSVERRVNTRAPSVSNVRLTTDDQNVDLVFESTEQLGNLTVDVDGTVDTNRTIDDATNRSVTGGYEYTVNVSDGRDGAFDVELASFEDRFGKNGTGGQTATTSVDTTAPTVQSFELVQSGQDLDVRVNASEPLGSLSVSLAEDASGTLSLADASNETDGNTAPFVYVADVADTDGLYEATLDTATDATGNDGAGGETRETRVNTQAPSVSNVRLTTDGQNVDLVFETTERLSNLTVDVDGTVDTNRTVDDATNSTLAGGGYEYTVNVSDGRDGAFDVELASFEDRFGKNGTGGQTATTTVDTVQPTVPSFEFVQSGRDLDVRVNSSEPLGSLSITLAGDTSGTLSLADASNETSDPTGPYVYRADVAGADGLYEATLDTAADATGNDGASGESVERRVNTRAPSVSNVRLTTDGQNVDLVFESTEQLGNLTVDVDGAVDTNRTIDDSTNRTLAGGGYEYTVNVSDGREGGLEVELVGFEDRFGKNGTGGQTATATVDTTAPTVQSFELVQSGQDLDVRVNASEPLGSLSISLGEDASGTLSLADASNETTGATGPFVYVADVADGSGSYRATLDTAADTVGNDAATGQTRTESVAPPPDDSDDPDGSDDTNDSDDTDDADDTDDEDDTDDTNSEPDDASDTDDTDDTDDANDGPDDTDETVAVTENGSSSAGGQTVAVNTSGDDGDDTRVVVSVTTGDDTSTDGDDGTTSDGNTTTADDDSTGTDGDSADAGDDESTTADGDDGDTADSDGSDASDGSRGADDSDSEAVNTTAVAVVVENATAGETVSVSLDASVVGVDADDGGDTANETADTGSDETADTESGDQTPTGDDADGSDDTTGTESSTADGDTGDGASTGGETTADSETTAGGGTTTAGTAGGSSGTASGGTTTAVSGLRFDTGGGRVDYAIRTVAPREGRLATYEIVVREGTLSNPTYEFDVTRRLPADASPSDLRLVRIVDGRVERVDYRIVDRDDGAVTVAVDGTDSPDGVRYAFALPEPRLSVSAEITPTTPRVGESVTVSVTVANEGPVTGERSVTVAAGDATATRTLTVPANTSRTLTVGVMPTESPLTVTVGDETVARTQVTTATSTTGSGVGDGSGDADGDGDGAAASATATAGPIADATSGVGSRWTLAWLGGGFLVVFLLIVLWRRRDEEDEEGDDHSSTGETDGDPLADSFGDDD